MLNTHNSLFCTSGFNVLAVAPLHVLRASWCSDTHLNMLKVRDLNENRPLCKPSIIEGNCVFSHRTYLTGIHKLILCYLFLIACLAAGGLLLVLTVEIFREMGMFLGENSVRTIVC